MEVGESTVVLSELEDMALTAGSIRFALDDPQLGAGPRHCHCNGTFNFSTTSLEAALVC